MSLLKFSEAVSLAFHALAVMAHREEELLSTAQIAKTISASEAHLSKVMQRLAKAGLVSSTRGPHGGFALARKPEQVSLMDIYEAIEGPVKASGCLLAVPICDGKRCVLGRMVGEVNAIVNDNLEGHNLADLTKPFEGKPE